MASDGSEHLVRQLQDARGLAQQLWDVCRKSGSSYRLLSGSLRNLRNVLEEFEDLELRPDDMNIEAYVSQAYIILERLNSTFGTNQAAQSHEVDESNVSDFKTSLDVIGQRLNDAHETISMGEIPLKLDANTIPPLPSSSSHWGSTSASAVDSWHERRPSTRASSAYSQIAQDNPWRQSATSIVKPSSSPVEKEVYDAGVPQVEAANHGGAVMTEPTPSLDWRSPFAFPDPMSASIEQASSMILRDDHTLTPNVNDSRPVTNPVPSSQANTHDSTYKLEMPSNSGLGISEGYDESSEIDQRAEDVAAFAIRPRSASEAIGQASTAGSNAIKAPRLHAARSADSIGRLPPRRLSSPRKDATSYLSPTAIAQEFSRRNRTDSGASITFSTRTVESAEPTSDPFADNAFPTESYRKDLSIVFENAASEADEHAADITESDLDNLDAEQESSAPSAEGVAPPPPPPPNRRPPSPPKPRRGPKIPKRTSTYRIVNKAMSDDSSSDEDTSPTASKASFPAHARPIPQDEGTPSSSTSIDQQNSLERVQTVPASMNQQRLGSVRTTHAQRVLMARASYAAPTLSEHPLPMRSQTSAKSPAFTTKLSTLSLNFRRNSDEPSPTLKRYPTSAVSSSNRPVTAEEPVPGPKPPHMSEASPKLLPGTFVSKFESADSVTMPSGSSLFPSEDGASMLEKEKAPETGLEFDDQLGAGLQRSHSIEAPDVVQEPEDNVESFEAFDVEQAVAPEPVSNIDGANAPSEDTPENADIESEHIIHIVHFWNRCAWDQAESYLTGYLEHLLDRNMLDRVRRIRHLLGVCASFRGQWERAISFFLAVLRTPIGDIYDLDDGDCAAAYWLGDTYAMLNRRIEAILAYRIAERSSFFEDSKSSTFCECIDSEQEAVQLETPLVDLKSLWARESDNLSLSGLHSLLDTRTVTATAARKLFDRPRRSRNRETQSAEDTIFQLDPNKSRLALFYALGNIFDPSKYQQLKITSPEFEPDGVWPMMYDPFISIANIRQGRLLLHESDLLAAFNSNPLAKVPKAGPTNIARMESFASPDLSWLITTLRACLTMLEMEWSEVSHVRGSWFMVRYSFIEENFATTQYFSIAILKHSLRSGYGVEICPDGISAARIIRSGLNRQKGVHIAEQKRVKKLIREYLDNAAKQRVKTK